MGKNTKMQFPQDFQTEKQPAIANFGVEAPRVCKAHISLRGQTGRCFARAKYCCGQKKKTVVFIQGSIYPTTPGPLCRRVPLPSPAPYSVNLFTCSLVTARSHIEDMSSFPTEIQKTSLAISLLPPFFLKGQGPFIGGNSMWEQLLPNVEAGGDVQHVWPVCSAYAY